VDPIVVASARKHGIPDDFIVHAMLARPKFIR